MYCLSSEVSFLSEYSLSGSWSIALTCSARLGCCLAGEFSSSQRLLGSSFFSEVFLGVGASQSFSNNLSIHDFFFCGLSCEVIGA
jgi:hypothetical protein